MQLRWAYVIKKAENKSKYKLHYLEIDKWKDV